MSILNKNQMSEEDIKLQYITPAITSKWDVAKITMETRLTDGKINLKGNFVVREKPKRADYVLYLSPNNPIAIIEAKDNKHSISHGLQQAKKEEKMKRFGKYGELYVSPSTGLAALTENRYKFFIFGKSTLACVYRLADLYGYDYESEEIKNSEGKTETRHYCVLMFHNTPGMYLVRLELRSSYEFEAMSKYFDTLFGIQKTLGNIKNTWKNQINAVKAVAGAVKSVKDGTIDEAVAENTIDALDTMQYGDRTEWIQKADAALASVQK